ncbi:dTMP kinase [Tepidicaulis sp. LMO-SS28]|uniref:dTMP kinase n=1 Tax=Tepidicaulis sp. LMO-SS28 TaxID=3447455 RepID=UPI003EE2157C
MSGSAHNGPGRFITFEGGEGAGKSSHTARLAEWLRAQGIDVVTTREPGGSPGAEAIRKLLVEGEADRWSGKAEALLHFAARADHLERTIRPALAAGKWVICDRFADSTMAYQGYGHGLEPEVIQTLYDLVVGQDGPDFTLVLDLPVEEGLKRAASRGGGEDRYEGMDLSFHERLRQAFLKIAKAEPERCAVIDATQPMEKVTADILDAVASHFGIKGAS